MQVLPTVEAATTPLYRGGWQLTKVRVFMWFALLCAAGALYWGVDLVQHYGLNPGDGGVLAPLWARLAWGIVVASLGVAFVAAMWLYGRCYIARIEYDEPAQTLHIFTTGFLTTPRHVIPVAGLVGSRPHDGTFAVGNGWTLLGASPLTVNAPWRSITLAGWRLPLVFDEQGELLEPELLKQLFMPPPPRARGRRVR